MNDGYYTYTLTMKVPIDANPLYIAKGLEEAANQVREMSSVTKAHSMRLATRSIAHGIEVIDGLVFPGKHDAARSGAHGRASGVGVMAEEKTCQQLREDVVELAAALINLLDRGVVSGHHERDRLGTLPALRRGAELQKAE